MNVKAGGKRHVLPKRRLAFNGLHGIISQKMELFITTAVRTSNPAFKRDGVLREFGNACVCVPVSIRDVLHVVRVLFGKLPVDLGVVALETE
jgi:hypothetical protein